MLIFDFYRGGGPQTNSAEHLLLLKSLKSDIQLLENNERYLDEQIKYMQLNKNILFQDEESKK